MSSIYDWTAAWAQDRQLSCEALSETASTNDLAKQNSFSEPSPYRLYLAAHQSAGRGRTVNSWQDTGHGENLLCSWSVELHSAPQAITGPRVGLALYLAAQSCWPSLGWGLKAPNDLYLEGAKIAGLLIETLSHGAHHRIVIGLGLNVGNHPRALNPATHLAAHLTQPLEAADWFHFLDQWRMQLKLALLDALSPQLSPEACQGLKNALNANRGNPFTVLSVSPEGSLSHRDGTIRWTDL